MWPICTACCGPFAEDCFFFRGLPVALHKGRRARRKMLALTVASARYVPYCGTQTR